MHGSTRLRPEPSSQHGVIVVDKPSGMTSARVVGTVKRALNLSKIGHTGTLDPMATGVLPLCIGEGTKIAGYLSAEDKGYEGSFLLGVETDTLDRQGKVLREDRAAAAMVTRDRVLEAISNLTGAIEQVPPMFSALKQGGRRLHSLARKGEVVERPPRSVHVHRFDLFDFEEGAGTGRFSVKVSKGTYVRSLVDDMGHALGCGAHLTALRRTQSGRFTLSEAVTLDQIEAYQEGKSEKLRVLDPAQAISHLPKVLLPSEQLAAVADGKRIAWQLVSDDEPPSDIFALLTPSGKGLVAIAVLEEERLRYRRVFNYALTP